MSFKGRFWYTVNTVFTDYFYFLHSIHNHKASVYLQFCICSKISLIDIIFFRLPTPTLTIGLVPKLSVCNRLIDHRNKHIFYRLVF